MILVQLLLACAVEEDAMEDNSLEEATVSSEGTSGGSPTGTLGARAVGNDGDWLLTVSEVMVSYHSPSRVDFAGLDGRDVTLLVGESDELAPLVVITDASGPLFVESTNAGDGTSAFGHPVWAQGKALGSGSVDDAFDTGAGFEEQPVQFTDVVVTADDGEHRLVPGEPESLKIDGSTWRFSVLTAYLAVNQGDAKCGAPDVLAVELVRTEQAPGPALRRPMGSFPPVGSCN